MYLKKILDGSFHKLIRQVYEYSLDKFVYASIRILNISIIILT